MAVVTEIIKNILIKIPFVKHYAKKKHITGVNQSEEGIDAIFNLYKNHVDFSAKDVIELGPGHTFGVACKIKESGAKSVSIIDIEKYIPDIVLQQNDFLNYIIYDGNEMPVKSESYDIALSYTVFEHLRSPQITIDETYRILRKGGMVIHLIDLADHLFYGPRGNPDKIFNCLRYSKKIWNMMSYNRSIYVNRLRQTEWIEMHTKAGFKIIHTDATEAKNIKRLFEEGGVKYLLKYKPEDRFISNILLVAKK